MCIDLKNKKLLKEWEKIKDSDIFPSFEAFAEFYYTNGEKPCFRINTNEPWSKDNFFFGEYSELLVYYKEEQPKKRIGQRFHSLTVLDVFWQEKDGKDTLFAKCKCDCGNEAIKTMDALTKGNARTCGCNRGRKKSTTPKKIIPISKELVDELWGFEKNNVDPTTVDCESTQKYWWKNVYGNSFELEPFVFIKPDTQTSFPEQAIFYYIKKYFNDAINKARYITQYGEVVEIDVFIPSLNVGIEYDGVFWHKNKYEIDEEKNKSLNDDGVFVIRVREEGLNRLCDFYGATIIRNLPLQNNYTLVDSINSILQIIFKAFCTKCKFERINIYDFEKEIYGIYALTHNTFVKDNIESSKLSTFWDFDKNAPLSPMNVSAKNNNIPLYFKCQKGFECLSTPKAIVPSSDKGLYILCPLSEVCKSKDRRIKCEKFAQDLMLRESYFGKNYNASRNYRVCFYINDDTFLSVACNKNSTLFLNKDKYEDALEFICLCSMDYHREDTQLKAFQFVYDELSMQSLINPASFFKSIIEQISITEIPKVFENVNICQLLVNTYGISYVIDKILKPQLSNFSFRLFSAACNFVLSSQHLSRNELIDMYNILRSRLSNEVFKAFSEEIYNATNYYVDKNIICHNTKIQISELFGKPLITAEAKNESDLYHLEISDVVSQEKTQLVDTNKCQYCGGNLKKKHLLFAKIICAVCGKEKN